MKFLLTLLGALATFPSAAYVTDEDMSPTDPNQAIVNEAVQFIERKMGVNLLSPAILYDASLRGSDPRLDLEIERAREERHALFTTFSVRKETIGDLRRWTINRDDPQEFCLIVPGTVDLATMTPLQRRSALAHETFHCFQVQLLGSQLASRGLSEWIREGGANWVGEIFAEGSDGGFMNEIWSDYFLSDRALLLRDYDAFPFFVHLSRSGFEPWAFLRRIVTSIDSQEAWDNILDVVPERIIGEWGAGLFRHEAAGDPWTVKYLREINSVGTPPVEDYDTAILPQSIETAQAQPRLLRLRVPQNQLLKLQPLGATALLRVQTSGGERTLHLFQNQNLILCWGPNCSCGDGGPSTNVVEMSGGQVDVALTGLDMDVSSLELGQGTLHCCGMETPTGLDRRLVGTWRLNEVRTLVDTWSPGTPAGTEKGFVGGETLRIRANGSVQKSFEPLRLWLVYRKRNQEIRDNLLLEGDFRACVTTRATGEQQGWLQFRNVNDATNQSRWGGMGESEMPGDWLQTSLCIHRADAIECRGNYRFMGPGNSHLKILGKSGYYTRIGD